MMVDTHAHLDQSDFDADREDVLVRAKENGVGAIVTVGCDIPSSEWAVRFAGQHQEIYAIIGIHPQEVKDAPDDAIDRLADLASDKKVLGIGEIGLDYYYELSPRDLQKEFFFSQLRLADRLGLPVIIHDRDAHGDTMDILKQMKAGKNGGILHCFSGSLEMAKECIKMGFFISFAGPLTFKNARRPKEIAAALPEERLLVETDCPYLAPTPFRGQRNEPAFVRYIVEELARLRGVSFEDAARFTVQNTMAAFAPRFSLSI